MLTRMKGWSVLLTLMLYPIRSPDSCSGRLCRCYYQDNDIDLRGDDISYFLYICYEKYRNEKYRNEKYRNEN